MGRPGGGGVSCWSKWSKSFKVAMLREKIWNLGWKPSLLDIARDEIQVFTKFCLTVPRGIMVV